MEKKLRIFDLSTVSPNIASNNSGGTSTDYSLIHFDKAFEIGPGVHQGTIKSIVWTRDPNILVTAADDKVIRWWDLRSQTVVQEKQVEGDIGTCELSNLVGTAIDIGGGMPVLTIAAGKTVYFYGGHNTRTLLKSVELPYEVASVALHAPQRKFVTGGLKDTWVKVYDYDTEQEIGQ
jgi:serine-threonine kinase receptor-associated protein